MRPGAPLKFLTPPGGVAVAVDTVTTHFKASSPNLSLRLSFIRKKKNNNNDKIFLTEKNGYGDLLQIEE